MKDVTIATELNKIKTDLGKAEFIETKKNKEGNDSLIYYVYNEDRTHFYGMMVDTEETNERIIDSVKKAFNYKKWQIDTGMNNIHEPLTKEEKAEGMKITTKEKE